MHSQDRPKGYLDEDREALEARRQAEAQQYLADLRKVLDIDDGAGVRVIRAWLVRMGGIFQDVYTGNATTYYNVGRSETAQKIFKDIIAVDPVKAFEIFAGTSVVKELRK